MSVDATVAARVPLDLRKDLEAVVDKWRRSGRRYPDGRDVDLSFVQRHALRELTDRELGRARPLVNMGLGATAGAQADGHDYPFPPNAAAELERRGGAARSSDPSTSKDAAALQQPPKVGTQRWRALEAFEAAGDRGLTTDEVVVKLKPAPHNGTARRVTDLLQGGYIEERLEAEVERRAAIATGLATRLNRGAVERKTRAGAWARVWVITRKGRAALESRRQDQRDPGGRR